MRFQADRKTIEVAAVAGAAVAYAAAAAQAEPIRLDRFAQAVVAAASALYDHPLWTSDSIASAGAINSTISTSSARTRI